MNANKKIDDSFRLWVLRIIESDVTDKEKVDQLLMITKNYHMKKVNNSGLDDVINCPSCGGSYIVTDLDDRCLCKDCKTKWRVCL